MIKKHFYLFAITFLTIIMGGCSKTDNIEGNNCVANNTGIPTAAEVASLQAYLTANNIIASQHPDGFFYRIITSHFIFNLCYGHN